MVIDNNDSVSLPSCGDSALPSGNSYAIMAAEFDSRGGKNMAIDMKRKKQYDNEWQRQNCIRINFRFLYKGIIINHNKNRANLH